MRQHYWQYLLNTEGQPVDAAYISVYEAGTTTPLYVYTQEAGGIPTNIDPQVTTDENGYFEFWIADANDTTYGYAGIKIKIQWVKGGAIDTGFVDNVDFLVGETSAYTFNEVITSTSTSLIEAQLSNTVLNNYGQTNDVIVSLPVASRGLLFTVIFGATVAKYFRIDPDVSDSIYLAGATTGAGMYVGIATAAIGDSIQFRAVQTGAATYSWFATSVRGTWLAEV